MQTAHAQDCADDPAYPLNANGGSGGVGTPPVNCEFFSRSSTPPWERIECDFTANAAGGTPAQGIDVHVVYYDNGSAYQLHVFGEDGDGETFCQMVDINVSTGSGSTPTWDVVLDGTGFRDLFDFDHNGYDLRSHDETVTTVKLTIEALGGDDEVTLPQNNYGHDCVVNGGGDIDTIYGSPLSDTIDGQGGDDIIEDRGGADDLYGGSGVDTIEGGDGNDRIDGGTGPDTLKGDGGDDLLCAGDMTTTSNLYGGDGEDDLWNGSSGGIGQSNMYGESPNAPLPPGMLGDKCTTSGTYIRQTCEYSGSAPLFCGP